MEPMYKKEIELLKIDILKHAEVLQRKELSLRREDENRVFLWVNAIMVAANGAQIIARFC